MEAIRPGIGSRRLVLSPAEITLTLDLGPLACHTVWLRARIMSLQHRSIRNAPAASTHLPSALGRAVKRVTRPATVTTRCKHLLHTV